MGRITQMFGKNSGRLVKVFKIDAGSVPDLSKDSDSDGYDRLSYKWSVHLCLALAAASTLAFLVGKPVLCWPPAHFKDLKWREYTDTLCWLSNTYHVPLYETLPNSVREREEDKVIYYRWITWFFFAQAVVFYLPWAVWQLLNSTGAIDIRSTMQTAKRRSYEADEGKRQLSLDIIAQQINLPITYSDQYMSSENGQHKVLRQRVVGKMSRAHFNFPVTFFYLFLKLCFIVNACVALFGTNNFVQPNFYRYGIDLLKVQPDDDLATNGMFTRVTMCDMDVRRLGHNQRYTIQCLLTNNFFYEKIFFVFWAWLWVVLIGSVLGLISLIISVFAMPYKRLHIHDQLKNGLALKLFENKDKTKREAIRKQFRLDERDISNSITRFIKFLGFDGCLILRFLSPNALEECEVVEKLWSLYQINEMNDQRKRETMLPPYEAQGDVDVITA